MSKLLFIRFGRRLERYDLEGSRPAGPCFHRWLPDGERDAIVLTAPEAGTTIRIWFERWGVMKDGWAVYQDGRRELDAAAISRQGLLDAGPLYGDARISVTSGEYAAIQESRTADEKYAGVCKRIVKRILQSHVNRLISILRRVYGQYWIDPAEDWDSRQVSLAGYCRRWNLRWSANGNDGWSRFFPGERPTVYATATLGAPWAHFLSQQDWSEIGALFLHGYDPPLAGVLIARAHELAAEDQLRYAFMEGVTGLEAAIEQFYECTCLAFAGGLRYWRGEEVGDLPGRSEHRAQVAENISVLLA